MCFGLQLQFSVSFFLGGQNCLYRWFIFRKLSIYHPVKGMIDTNDLLYSDYKGDSFPGFVQTGFIYNSIQDVAAFLAVNQGQDDFFLRLYGDAE